MENKTYTASFQFDMNDIDARMDHLRHTKAFDMALALSDIKDYLAEIQEDTGITSKKRHKIINDINNIYLTRNIDISELLI